MPVLARELCRPFGRNKAVEGWRIDQLCVSFRHGMENTLHCLCMWLASLELIEMVRMRQEKSGQSREIAYHDHHPLPLRLTSHKMRMSTRQDLSAVLLQRTLLRSSLLKRRLLAPPLNAGSATNLCFLGRWPLLFVGG